MPEDASSSAESQHLHPCCLFTAPGPAECHMAVTTSSSGCWAAASRAALLGFAVIPEDKFLCLSPPQSGAEDSSPRSMVTQEEPRPANTITSCSMLGASSSLKSWKNHQETPLALLWEIIEQQLLLAEGIFKRP